MRNKKDVLFPLINTALPIGLGGLLYYLISPDVLFVRLIDRFLGGGIHLARISNQGLCALFIRNYLLDMLWGYALLHALFFIIGNHAAGLRRAFLIAFSFSAMLEILQLAPGIPGTFDVWDIIGECSAEAAAAWIIKKRDSRIKRGLASGFNKKTNLSMKEAQKVEGKNEVAGRSGMPAAVRRNGIRKRIVLGRNKGGHRNLRVRTDGGRGKPDFRGGK